MDPYAGVVTRRRDVPLRRGVGQTWIDGKLSQTWSNTTSGVWERSGQVQTRETLYPFVQHLFRTGYFDRFSGMGGWFRNQDWGSGHFYVNRLERRPRYENLSVSTRQTTVERRYSGPFGVYVTDAYLISMLTSGVPFPSQKEIQDALVGSGGSAISRVNPLKSQNQILVSIIELVREGLPKMVGLTLLRDKGNGISAVGSEYLNYQFGIMPVISDIMSLCETVLKIDKLMSDFHNRANKELRRRYSFPVNRISDVVTGTFNVAPNPAEPNVYKSHAVTGLPYASRQYQDRTWFSGAFRYYSPTGDSLDDILTRGRQEAQYILGLRLTLDTLWELAPWSWLIDYFTNIGDVLSNISYIGNDGLVLRYGYCMREISVHAELGIKSNPVPAGQSLPVIEDVSLVRKSRIRALPYGFQLPAADFTPKQWAILGALGLSRAPKTLF